MNLSNRLRRRILVLACGLMLAQSALAFRSTNVESFTDPDYKDFRPHKVLIIVINAANDARTSIEARIVEKLTEYGVAGVKERELFPPTREWTPDSRAAILKSNGIDSSLIVAVGESSASIRNVGTQTFATTNINGTVDNTSGTVRGTAHTNATSYNMIAASSKADFSAALIDVSNGRTAWYADITTKAQGTLFVGGKGDAKGAVKGIIEGLVDDGHLSKKK
jgi:hypothetical protein